MDELLPREKLIKYGVESLSDYDLLAIMLGTGTKAEDVFKLSKRLIDSYGFEKLFRMNYKELSRLSGIKDAKATKLISIFEITRRIIKKEFSIKRIENSKDLFNFIYPDYALLNKEVLTVIYLDNNINIIKKDKFYDNSYDSVSFPIKKIIIEAIKLDSYGIYLIHNHPNGNPLPSDADMLNTKRITMGLNAVEIKLLDHIIIANDTYYSFLDDV